MRSRDSCYSGTLHTGTETTSEGFRKYPQPSKQSKPGSWSLGGKNAAGKEGPLGIAYFSA